MEKKYNLYDVFCGLRGAYVDLYKDLEELKQHMYVDAYDLDLSEKIKDRVSLVMIDQNAIGVYFLNKKNKNKLVGGFTTDSTQSGLLLPVKELNESSTPIIAPKINLRVWLGDEDELGEKIHQIFSNNIVRYNAPSYYKKTNQNQEFYFNTGVRGMFSKIKEDYYTIYCVDYNPFKDELVALSDMAENHLMLVANHLKEEMPADAFPRQLRDIIDENKYSQEEYVIKSNYRNYTKEARFKIDGPVLTRKK